MDAIRVLLAEDHAVVRQATAEVIDHQPDMQVVGQAGTGREAVELARVLHPDVVVMDIAMPHLDGLEATRRIKGQHAECQILVLTAREEEHYVIEMLQAGAVGYLPKTVDLDGLLDGIRAVARGEAVFPPGVASVLMRHMAGGRAPERVSPLTERERQVLTMVARGLTNRDIARRLAISVRTVETHLTHVFDKLDACSRTEAAVRAIREGWIDVESGDTG